MRARSLMDRVGGFGPPGGGSSPPGRTILNNFTFTKEGP